MNLPDAIWRELHLVEPYLESHERYECIDVGRRTEKGRLSLYFWSHTDPSKRSHRTYLRKKPSSTCAVL